MLGLSDILAVLDRWPTWKALKEAPARIEALEKRLSALEASPTNPETVCPVDGTQMKWEGEVPSRHFGVFGQMDETWRCPACGLARIVQRKPG
ncbi:hypothetical protein [Roseococcus pinisoli]|uniref:Uncharacterized protein n=1 Tax=Roseococcus pinisoli TaxID=2835040 RepID=A0ABS5Q9X9_9PROT|nr:hypothetical protein [Roseococcus pinisoli]MBS7810516.1 hypothetical protein [Roseococcus pinisoli]